MKLTLDVENTVTHRDGKLHLDPFEKDNKLVMVGCLTDTGKEYLYRDNYDGLQDLLNDATIQRKGTGDMTFYANNIVTRGSESRIINGFRAFFHIKISNIIFYCFKENFQKDTIWLAMNNYYWFIFH